MKCQWQIAEDGVGGTCQNCGTFRKKVVYTTGILHRRCGADPPLTGELGDRVKKALDELGITEERWLTVKAEFGWPPSCNCEKRRAWLNRVSRWLRGETAEKA